MPTKTCDHLLALSRILERERRMGQGRQAEHQVVAEKHPRRQRSAREQLHTAALDLALNVEDEHDRRNRVDQEIQQGTAVEEVLKPSREGARRILLRAETGTGSASERSGKK